MPSLRAGVHHLAVCVTDLERAEAFYAGVLGLAVRKRWSDDAGAPRSIWLELGGGAFLAVERVTGGDLRHDAAPGHHCVVLRIEPSEREAWRARLENAGHPIERESAFTLYVRDPEGALIGLSHHPVASPSE